ncbi:MAG: acetolactate synthase small subunit [Planctomycetes bacterium RIFCSPHIGHO2_02_FULL_50_42]|uniref:acetolactate synthase small subunit n=1 Tax=Candidatus Avalokitesvara rifleensis TaxID=3367620 RepID=UPI0008BC27E6|nr:acetolactate synthase small subunit [Candidatus Brocadiales bacterium]OHB37334.1 MAG: acetolactate synthase small subunit [Planctomycetes bacterium GWA2_50_13]OHB89650.1 MAG: acetolactate synthase small subunit [Planctomycetes bacterium RIFCSPHIGHO2_02_FULL_50_42]OHB92473.1 MAG: acetolactate synthase small subunit [Planctomycetes bacterium RIFCSPHIGHO2_12_FULL_51_37]OHB94834.1 MAG: acetolactate synthase small subunit [Planctomycetes bacterium RIFCSPLOWO2_02_FULL_50_16]OHC02634.1 MAG: acetol
MKHTITAIVGNKVGVLARIVGLFSSRGFNIDSLNVGETDNPNLSRLTIVVNGDDAVLEQVRKQLGKVIDVLKVSDLTNQPYVERDLMLVKVNAPPGKRNEILEVVDIFRGKIVDVGQKEMIVELSGTEDKVAAMLKLLQPYGIKETARTGQIAMLRGTK